MADDYTEVMDLIKQCTEEDKRALQELKFNLQIEKLDKRQLLELKKAILQQLR